MSEFMGIKGWYTGDILPELKRSALVFDKVVLKHVHAEHECKKFPYVVEELDFLKERGFIVDAPEVTYNTETHPWLAEYDPLIINNPTKLVQRFLLGHFHESMDLLDSFTNKTYVTAADTYARVAALAMRQGETLAMPILLNPLTGHVGLPTRKAQILQLVYENIPLPTEMTSWSDIWNWRADAEAKRKFARLRVWINKTGRTDTPFQKSVTNLNRLFTSTKRIWRRTTRHSVVENWRFSRLPL